MSNILGVSAGFHDAALAVISNQGDILFAAHSERYSKLKNDPNISSELIEEIRQFDPTVVAYYERPWAKQLRRLYAGEKVDLQSLTVKQILQKQLGAKLVWDQIHSFNHHQSHAAAGFQTSRFSEAAVVVIDAIGEWDTISIWAAEYINNKAHYKLLWRQLYPHSIGLFYSAITKRVGLKPMEDEYILMGMSAYGNDSFIYSLQKDLLHDIDTIKFKQNLHLGIDTTYLDQLDNFDLAASAQRFTEKLIIAVMRKARDLSGSDNLVYMGGVALNCSANRLLGNYFDNIWIMPCPGDAGSSLGAAALAYGKQLNWKTAYLGHNIPGSYPVESLLAALLTNKIAGVASGPAEFGPRALGNRSLLADPRGSTIRDTVNNIKQRQKFRPFAPVILEEIANNYFDLPSGFSTSPYMQVVALCKNPQDYPAIVHIDNTSRVQTVGKDGSGIRRLLEAWYATTGCPMLLNTSLNVKGQPMVNDLADAKNWSQVYNIPVFS